MCKMDSPQTLLVCLSRKSKRAMGLFEGVNQCFAGVMV